MARALRISRRRISFAGTKDRRAGTTQLFQFDGSPEALDRIRLKDVEVLETFRTDRKLEIGDLLGNRFRIVVRDVPLSESELRERAEATERELRILGGFPNLFGLQRFGSVRAITHVRGRHLLRGERREAAMAYVANPIEGGNPGYLEVRGALEGYGGVAAAL